jgi:hypothetical protein
LEQGLGSGAVIAIVSPQKIQWKSAKLNGSIKMMKQLITAALLVIAGFAGYQYYQSAEGGELKEALVARSCSPTSEDYRAEVLGYLEATDEVQDQTYAFIICQITDLTEVVNNPEASEIKIASNLVTGTSLTPAEAAALAVQAETQNQDYFVWGNPYVPTGELDPKRIEYRFYQEGGQLVAAEVYVITRAADRSAKPTKTLRVDWPTI